MQLKAPSNSMKYLLLPRDECPAGGYSLSKLLGISMQELWEVSIECDLAKQKGKRETFLIEKSFDSSS
jgi:hypothetical protein